MGWVVLMCPCGGEALSRQAFMGVGTLGVGWVGHYATPEASRPTSLNRAASTSSWLPLRKQASNSACTWCTSSGSVLGNFSMAPYPLIFAS